MQMPVSVNRWGRIVLVSGSITIFVFFLFIVTLGSIQSVKKPSGNSTNDEMILKISITPEGSKNTSHATNPSGAAPHLSTTLLPSFAQTLPNSANTTQKLAAQVAQELIRLNPNGPTAPNGAKGVAVPDAEKLVNDFLAQGAKNFDYEKLKPAIKDGDVHIIETTDPLLLAQYLKSFLTISNRIPTSLNDPDAGSIDILVSVYDGYIRDYSALEVPRMLMSIHKKNLATLVATKRMLATVRDYQNDPLQAILALKSLENVRADMQALYTEVALFIADHQLKISS